MEGIKAQILDVAYARPFPMNPNLTLCCITMCNGFSVLGKSAPASAGNFDAAIGERYAYDDAFKQLWQFEGYLLRQHLHDSSDKQRD